MTDAEVPDAETDAETDAEVPDAECDRCRMRPIARTRYRKAIYRG